jgi:hypothetical protein
MPNHCSNYLELSADPSDRKAVSQLANFSDISIIPNEDKDAQFDDIRFTFDGVLPMPKELDIKRAYPKDKTEEEHEKANIEKYGYADWYDWRWDNWGTKWDAYDCYVNELLKDYCSISFDTAWSPPIPYYLALSKKYPLLKIEIEYSEPGMDFAGRQSYFDGELIDDVEMTYSEYEYLEDYPSWFDRFYDTLEDDCYGSLEDFKENYSEVWKIMNKEHRKEIRKAFKEHENEKSNQES